MGSRWLEALMESRPEEVPERPEKNPVLYYKTRTIRSGNLTEVESYPVYSWNYRRMLNKTHPTSEAMRTVNNRNARKKFERLAECNFRPGTDYALHLTYAGKAPDNSEQCEKDLRNYMRRVNRARKKLGLGKARCIGVIETGSCGGRLHHHLLIEGGLDRDTMEQLWGLGHANCDRIREGVTALVRYMTKGFDGKRENGRHRYFYTKNLVRPRVTESRSRISRRQAERIREDADMNAEVIIRKKWPDRKLESVELKQSDWLPGVYIYARMRR